MKSILFVTSRNIITTCGELRLIKNRAETLFNDFQIRTDFLALAKKQRLLSVGQERIQAGGTTKFIKTNVNNPFSLLASFIKLNRILRLQLLSRKYDAIMLSGVGTYHLAPSIKRVSNTTSIVLDCHGAYETPLLLASGKNIFKKGWCVVNSYFDRLGLKQGFKYFDGCFVVSKALENYLKQRFCVPEKLPFYIVPCATENQKLDLKVYEEYRKKYREKYKINDRDIVFVYSGGTSNWQCIEETINLYQLIKKDLQYTTHLLMFSHNLIELKKIVNRDISIHLDSYSPSELEKALCAGDYAFLLRKKSIVNEVAFPNKFLEYIKSRMRIIATPYVEEIKNQIVKYDVGCIVDFEKDLQIIYNDIEKHNMSFGNSIETIEMVLKENSFSHTLRRFCIDLSEDRIRRDLYV